MKNGHSSELKKKSKNALKLNFPPGVSQQLAVGPSFLDARHMEPRPCYGLACAVSINCNFSRKWAC